MRKSGEKQRYLRNDKLNGASQAIISKSVNAEDRLQGLNYDGSMPELKKTVILNSFTRPKQGTQSNERLKEQNENSARHQSPHFNYNDQNI